MKNVGDSSIVEDRFFYGEFGTSRIIQIVVNKVLYKGLAVWMSGFALKGAR